MSKCKEVSFYYCVESVFVLVFGGEWNFSMNWKICNLLEGKGNRVTHCAIVYFVFFIHHKIII